MAGETVVEVRAWEHEDFPWRFVVDTTVLPDEDGFSWLADSTSALFETREAADRWAACETARLKCEGKLR